MQREAPAEGAFDVWPEHWLALHIFADLLTQWQVGYAGPVGLRYEVLPIVFDLRRVPRGKHQHVFTALRMMEQEALAYWREQRRH